MTTLGQIVGIHKGEVTSAQRDWTDIYHTFQADKGALFNGHHKEHYPFDNIQDNIKQPTSEKLVQANAQELLTTLRGKLTRLFDLEATKDTADTQARADVIIDGQVLLAQVPVGHLLWLEKKIADLVTVFRSIPVMSAAEKWVEDPSLPSGMLRTEVEETPTTKKINDFQIVVPAAANGNHPADVRPVTRDVHSGNYRTIKYTAALPAKDKEALQRRTSILLNALRQAIVVANHQEVTDIAEGNTVFDYLYHGTVA